MRQCSDSFRSPILPVGNFSGENLARRATVDLRVNEQLPAASGLVQSKPEGHRPALPIIKNLLIITRAFPFKCCVRGIAGLKSNFFLISWKEWYFWVSYIKNLWVIFLRLEKSCLIKSWRLLSPDKCQNLIQSPHKLEFFLQLVFTIYTANWLSFSSSRALGRCNCTSIENIIVYIMTAWTESFLEVYYNINSTIAPLYYLKSGVQIFSDVTFLTKTDLPMYDFSFF